MIPCKGRITIKQPIGLICLAVFSLLLTFGCSNNEENQKTSLKDEGEKSSVVATVGGRSITEADFKSYLSKRPVSYRGTVSEKDMEKRLDALILEEVLYQEALRLKLDQDPEVRQRMRQMLNQRLIDEQINRQVWDREIEAGELQEYYDQHRNEFNRPEQIRLADIYIAVSVDATKEERVELRKRAETVLGKALEARGKRRGFGTLVRRYSDKHETYGKGDTGFFDSEGKPAGIDRKLAEEAFKLERVGKMAGQLIETPEGYHIIMLIGKRSAVQRPLDAVREQLKQRLRREAVAKKRQAYLESLREKAQIEINDQSIGKFSTELNKNAYVKRSETNDNINQSRRLSDVAPPDFPSKGD